MRGPATGNGIRETEDRMRETGNRKWDTGNGKLKTGDKEWEMEYEKRGQLPLRRSIPHPLPRGEGSGQMSTQRSIFIFGLFPLLALQRSSQHKPSFA